MQTCESGANSRGNSAILCAITQDFKEANETDMAIVDESSRKWRMTGPNSRVERKLPATPIARLWDAASKQSQDVKHDLT